MKRECKLSFVAVVIMGLLLSHNTPAQEQTKKEEKEGYKFTVEKNIKVTPVRNQYRSGTCWSFSCISFLEAEMLRMGKEEVDLSEMFIVRKAYEDRAEIYVRMHGKFNFGGGGAANDPVDMIRKYGCMPEEAYPGLTIGEDKHIHGEMDNVLQAMVDAVIENKNRKLSPQWHNAFKGALDAYLGKTPENFNYKGKNYTPQTFSKEVVGINPDDYVLITSYTHHPFYEKFIVEVPDNWSLKQAQNVPLDELIKIIDNAINSGFTIVWAADVSEKGFSWKNGVAIVPSDDIADIDGLERAKWDALSEEEKNKRLYSFEKPIKEKDITQPIRQEAFDNYSTTDDHGMHITGIAKDQNGAKYYIVKNSWGTDGNDYKGYMYASEAYVKYKTMSILIHKNSIPKEIATKLKF